jgi:hypothetical protein
LAPNNSSATVILDGSQSSDNDPLEFSWYAVGETNLLATGAVASNQFTIGTHTVRLAVSDGQDTSTAHVRFEVITPGMAVGQLVLLVRQADLKHNQPLLASLDAARKSFDRGKTTAALNQLAAFQNKVRGWIQTQQPQLAGQLLTVSKEIITIVSEHEH